MSRAHRWDFTDPENTVDLDFKAPENVSELHLKSYEKMLYQRDLDLERMRRHLEESLSRKPTPSPRRAPYP